MTEDSDSPIKIAIQNLKARRPKPRGRRQELAAYADELRNLLAEGWSRVEIIGEIQAQGGKISPALLRDVLQMAPAKPKQASRAKVADPNASAAPSPAAQRPAATAPFDRGQPASLVEPYYKVQQVDGAE